MPRFLHTADWQIGRLYASLPPENALPLAEARIACVERLAGLAAREAVDAVLVAGDVFDAQNVAERTVRRLFNAMSAWMNFTSRREAWPSGALAALSR